MGECRLLSLKVLIKNYPYYNLSISVNSRCLQSSITPTLQTGTVCDDRFNDVAATAICKEMDYECALSWSSGETGWETQNSYSIALDNVFCETDNFTECSFDLDHNCAHAEDVSLTCSYKCLTNDGAITAKLVDIEGRESTNGSGILLVTSKIDDIVSILVFKV